MAKTAKTDKPNILLIWGDDIGVSNLSSPVLGARTERGAGWTKD
jgi:hypothetical protein